MKINLNFLWNNYFIKSIFCYFIYQMAVENGPKSYIFEPFALAIFPLHPSPFLPYPSNSNPFSLSPSPDRPSLSLSPSFPWPFISLSFPFFVPISFAFTPSIHPLFFISVPIFATILLLTSRSINPSISVPPPRPIFYQPILAIHSLQHTHLQQPSILPWNKYLL